MSDVWMVFTKNNKSGAVERIIGIYDDEETAAHVMVSCEGDSRIPCGESVGLGAWRLNATMDLDEIGGGS